jgi:DNA-binding transcriptional ArsR family regulator
MKEIFTLKDLRQLKALSDPLRQRILDGMSAKPATTKQVAAAIGEKPTKLYHHVGLLEQAGLIKLIETRPNRGTVEKYYQAAAKKFAIDQILLSRAGEAANEVQNMILNALQAGLAEAQSGFASKMLKTKTDCYPIAAMHTRIRASRKQIAALVRQIQRWSARCQAAQNEEGEIEYSLTLAFHPLRERKSHG